MSDDLAKLLCFTYSVPMVKSESEWDELPENHKEQWESDALMIRRYLEAVGREP